MILLDTNVISELFRPAPDAGVMSWFDRQAGLPLYISAMTEAELWSGFHRLPAGKRKSTLQKLIAETLAEDFAGRILSFDSVAARAYGKISALRAELGKPLNTADGQIAAIAQVKGFKLATRNLKDFAHCGVPLVNPWSMHGAQE
jgi:toxin FitB